MALKKPPKKVKRDKAARVVRDIKPVGEFDQNPVALFYGRAGRGKTHLASTFPGPHLFLDINNERGLKTVKKVENAKFARIRNWDDFQEVYWWLREGQDFKTIVLDQITGLQDLAMLNVREHFRMDPEEPFQGFKKYGKLSGDMKEVLQNYREMSDLYNIVFLAHERAFDTGSEGDEGDLDPSVSARVMPSIGSYIEGACDIIGHCYIRNFSAKSKKTGKQVRHTDYCMRVGPHPTYITKIRRPPEDGRLPDFIVNPSYRKIVAIENGEQIVVKEKTSGKAKKRKKLKIS